MRVAKPTHPEIGAHVSRVQKVWEYARKHDSGKYASNEKMNKFFGKLIADIKAGEYETLTSSTRFIETEEYFRGFLVYKRATGTNKNESFHRLMAKLHNGMTMGPEFFHYSLLSLAYNHNLNLNIRLNFTPDVGHKEIYILDETIRLIRNIYGIEYVPNYIPTDAISVEGGVEVVAGIAPLSSLVLNARFYEIIPLLLLNITFIINM